VHCFSFAFYQLCLVQSAVNNFELQDSNQTDFDEKEYKYYLENVRN